MKIIAQVKKSYYELTNLRIPDEEMSKIMKKELLQKIDEHLLTFDQFFHEENDRESASRIYEAQYIVLSLDTFRDIGKILREHSNLNDYWMKQIQCLFVEKPENKSEYK